MRAAALPVAAPVQRPGASRRAAQAVDVHGTEVAGILAGRNPFEADIRNGHVAEPGLMKISPTRSLAAPLPYSSLSATTGSTRVARSAGRALAARAMAASSAVTPAKVAGSVAATP